MITRRSFLAALAGLPFVGKLIPQQVSARPRDYVTAQELAAFYRVKQLEVMALQTKAPWMITQGRDGWASDTKFAAGDRGFVAHNGTIYEFDLSPSKRLTFAEWDRTYQA